MTQQQTLTLTKLNSSDFLVTFSTDQRYVLCIAIALSLATLHATQEAFVRSKHNTVPVSFDMTVVDIYDVSSKIN